MNDQEMRATLTPLIQSACNLLFNPMCRGGAKGLEWKKVDEDFVIYPNGIDVTHPDGRVQAIRWENHMGLRVANVTIVDQATFDIAVAKLKAWLQSTE